jgi:hypothetical protein
MVDNGDGDKPIWFTEFGWSNHANHSDLGNWEQGVTSDQQADYFVRAVKYVRNNFPYVKKMFWYNERNQEAGKIQLDNYGLLKRDLSPKPVYTRIKSFLTSDEPAPLPEPTPVPTIDPTPLPDPTVEPDVDTEPAPDATPLPEPTVEPAQPRNLLPNGGFESGRRGWGVHGAKLTVARIRHDGRRAGRVDPRKRVAGISTTSKVLPDDVHALRITGWVKSRVARQHIRVEMREMVRGRVVAQRTMLFRTKGRKWRSMPSVRFQPTGLDDARIKVRIRPVGKRSRAIFVDAFGVTPAV